MEPVSLNERRAKRADDPRLWTPREALVKMLRDLDEGVIQLEHLIVVYGSHNAESGSQCGFVQAGSFKPFEQLGLLQTIGHSIIQDN
jgi:hypothetical protein